MNKYFVGECVILSLVFFSLFVLSCSEEYEDGVVDKETVLNNVNSVQSIATESLGDWDEGIIINDTLYFVSKTIDENIEYFEYDSSGDAVIGEDMLESRQFSCINVLGAGPERAVFIEYDNTGNVSSLRIRENVYTFERSEENDAIDVMCYNSQTQNVTIIPYIINGTTRNKVKKYSNPMTRGASADKLGNALDAIQMSGDVSEGDWSGLLDDVKGMIGAGLIEAVLKKQLWPFFTAYDWWKAPKNEMEEYIFGKSSISLLPIVENGSSHILNGTLLNTSTIPDVEWEWGNSTIPDKYKGNGKPNIVYYYVDVKGPSESYRLGPKVANHQSSFSFPLNKMTHGKYYFYSFLTGSGYTRKGSIISYYYLGNPPTYTHDNEECKWNDSTGKYNVSFHIAYQHLNYSDIEYQGLHVETAKGTKLVSFGVGRNGGYEEKANVNMALQESEFEKKSDGTVELTIKVKYWYVLYSSDKTQYVELNPFILKGGGGLCPDNNHPHAIDLGLPSGTKWCCCNVGASTPEGYGGYYAWGETNEKSSYSSRNYRYYNKNENKFVFIGSDIAGTSYDVAYVTMGNSWCMPSRNQALELIEKCSYQWKQKNGVYGMLVTGTSGNQIFLPAAGNHGPGGDLIAGECGTLWTSTLYDDAHSFYLLFNNDGIYLKNNDSRMYGQTIRPIRQ